MKALKPFGLFGGNESTAPDAPEDGRVVELFRSRAELRKQHEELGQELQRLRDRLKQQEAATARTQEMFAALETRLESADTGLSTLVFYHLRALWGDGREIIGSLIQDLAAKQEERDDQDGRDEADEDVRNDEFSANPPEKPALCERETARQEVGTAAHQGP